jgi:hypothetical protein
VHISKEHETCSKQEACVVLCSSHGSSQIGRHAELHQCIDELIKGAVDRERSEPQNRPKDSALLAAAASVGVGVGGKSERERVLGWLRRASIATRFDQPTLRHYQRLQDAWSDDVRHLDVKLQLLAGLLAQGACPSRPPGAPAQALVSTHGANPLTRRGLELCDELLAQHLQRQRLLSSEHWNQVCGKAEASPSQHQPVVGRI